MRLWWNDMKVYGPYVHKTGKLFGRKYVNIEINGKRTTMLYSRYLYQSVHKVILESDETVDHINNNKTDDRIGNLQVLPSTDNIKKSAKGTTFIEIVCIRCGNKAIKKGRYVRHNIKQGKSGPFCGRSCAAKASRV